MALVNVKKKVEKASDKLGLRPGEHVIAGCTTNPSGTMKKMLSKELGGAIGAALAGRGTDAPADGGLAERFPEGQSFLVLTNERLFVASLSALTGKPKEITAEWSRDEVETIVVEDGRMAMPLTVAFSDGTAVEVEGAKGSDPAQMGLAFAS